MFLQTGAWRMFAVCALCAAGGVFAGAAGSAQLRHEPEAEMTAGQVYRQAGPSVVSISATSPHDTLTGTGFFISGDGKLVTSAHVVNDAYQVGVSVAEDTEVRARVLGVDDTTDLAVLEIDRRLQPGEALEFARTSAVQVGDPVAVIGDPMRYAKSLSSGIVSAVNRTAKAPGVRRLRGLLQTDAAVNHGSSGGPVLDTHGRVVGMTAMFAVDETGQNAAGVAFAVPADQVKRSVATVLAGRPPR
jgi:S1-C subfamily serine protease